MSEVSDFEVEVGKSYINKNSGKNITVVFIHEASEKAMVEWTDYVKLTSTAMYIRDIKYYYTPKVEKFILDEKYIGPWTGDTYECVWVDDQFAVLIDLVDDPTVKPEARTIRHSDLTLNNHAWKVAK